MKKLILFFFISISLTSRAQVGIGTTNPDASAILQLNSTTKGFAAPKMTKQQREAIPNPVDGLLVFDTDRDTYWYYANSRWNELINTFNSEYKLPYNKFLSNGAAGDKFGFSVCLGSASGGFVGAPGRNSGAGSVYRLRNVLNNLWSADEITFSGGNSAGDAFGYAVAADRNYSASESFQDAIFSAPFKDSATVNDIGSVYLIYRSGNSFKRSKLYAPLAKRVAGAKFGRDVDIASFTRSSTNPFGYCIVGAPGANSTKGEAYVYKYNTNLEEWQLEVSLTDNLGAAADSFGLAVSLYYDATGDSAWAFVGAPYDDENGFTDVGSITAFRKVSGFPTWVRVGKISPTTAQSGANNLLFGYDIANCFKCNKFIVGSPGKTSGMGVVYDVDYIGLTGSTANFTMESIPSSGYSVGASSLGSGTSISAIEKSGNCNDIYLLIGGQSGLTGLGSSDAFGGAILERFNGNNWTVLKRFITDTEAENGFGFGKAVSIHTEGLNAAQSDMMLIGAPNQDLNGNNEQGKVQFIQLGE